MEHPESISLHNFEAHSGSHRPLCACLYKKIKRTWLLPASGQTWCRCTFHRYSMSLFMPAILTWFLHVFMLSSEELFVTMLMPAKEVRYASHNIHHILYSICHTPHTIRHASDTICYTQNTIPYIREIPTDHTPHIMRHTSCATRPLHYMSPTMHRIPHVINNVPYTLRHTLYTVRHTLSPFNASYTYCSRRSAVIARNEYLH